MDQVRFVFRAQDIREILIVVRTSLFFGGAGNAPVRYLGALLALLAVIATAGVTIWTPWRTKPPEPDPIRFSISPPADWVIPEVLVESVPRPGAAPGSGSRWQVSNAGDIEPSWRADGKELFYKPLAAVSCPWTCTRKMER